MKITCISDTHQLHDQLIIPPCDMIIHAGDFTNRGKQDEVRNFIEWYAVQESNYKILICGNHEVGVSKNIQSLQKLCMENNIILLNNEHVEINGLKIFGSPYSKEFGRWAYGLPDLELDSIWSSIDHDIDILVTHGPAFFRLDKCPGGHVGSATLTNHIEHRFNKLKLHVCGHIHESRGCSLESTNYENYVTINASICGIPYSDLIINPITIEI
jgi:Icc-related predicted phosphoesterase